MIDKIVVRAKSGLGPFSPPHTILYREGVFQKKKKKENYNK